LKNSYHQPRIFAQLYYADTGILAIQVESWYNQKQCVHCTNTEASAMLALSDSRSSFRGIAPPDKHTDAALLPVSASMMTPEGW
jgi:hypothetical protein